MRDATKDLEVIVGFVLDEDVLRLATRFDGEGKVRFYNKVCLFFAIISRLGVNEHLPAQPKAMGAETRPSGNAFLRAC